MGRPVRQRPRRHHGGNQRLHRFRPAPRRAGYRRLDRPCRHAGRDGHPDRRRRDAIIAGSRRRSLAEIESGTLHVLARARRHSHECRAASGGNDRRCRRPPAHRPLAQRPGRDRFQALGPRHHRRRSTPRSPTCSSRWRTRPRPMPSTIMPGFTHLQSAQPVTFGHHLLAYVEMLGRDRGRFADARKRLNECPLGAAALAGTVLPDRPAHDGGGARLRPPDRQFARRRLRPRFRPRNPGRRLDLRHASVALRRGDRDLDDAAVRLRRACPTSSPPARRSCRRSAIPTPPNWCAPRPAASSARSPAC